MSGYNDNQGFYDGQTSWNAGEQPGYSYDMGQDYVAEQDFMKFDYSNTTETQQQRGAGGTYSSSSQAYAYSAGSPGFGGSILTPDSGPGFYQEGNGDNYEDEPPLLEELGINFDHILQKTIAVLNPLKDPDAVILLETDLAGPLVFCLAFGSFLLLSGKVQFGYIYGIGVLGCLGLYLLLNLMSVQGISMGATVSVLGYCLLPMVVLSGVSILISLKGLIGTVVAAAVVLWCAISASKLFVTALTMDHQQPLIAYPCALLYGVFALLTMF